MQKRIVNIRGTYLGEGNIKICVPIMGRSSYEYAYLSEEALKAKADMLELRIDSISEKPSVQDIQDSYSAVRDIVPDLPILMTFRTQRDGGSGISDVLFYSELMFELINRKCGDLFDVERSAGCEAFIDIVAAAKTARVPVLGSYHNFEKTPDCHEMTDIFYNMSEMGADVVKLAVMSKSRRDVIRLLKASVYADEQLEAPIIAIAMGQYGRVTRFLGELTGSCMTFAQNGVQSAPGQLPIQDLRTVLSALGNG